MTTATGWAPPVWWRGLRAGAECFDAGRYWHAHEHWEREWRAHGELHRHYVKGLIQVAAAFHHLQRDHASAARRLLEAGATHLFANRPLSWPFDAAHLLAVIAVQMRILDQGRRPRLPALHLGRMMDAWAAEEAAAISFQLARRAEQQ